MAVYEEVFLDGTPYPEIPLGTTTVSVSSSSGLEDALSGASAGDRIVLADGTYSGDFTISGKSGSSTAGISIEAANRGQALIGSGSTFRVNNCAYVTIDGLMWDWQGEGETFQFRGSSHHCRLTRSTFGPSSHSTSSNVQTWVYVGDDCHTIWIDHNEFRNKGTSGNCVRVYGSFDKVDSGQGSDAGCRHVRIDHNLFRSVKPEVGNDKEPIRYGVSSMSETFANGVIERNVFIDCVCEPEVISVKMGAIRTSGNAVWQSIGGPVIRHGRNSVMSDNYVIDRQGTFGETIGSGGIRFYDADHLVSHNYIDGIYGGNFQGSLMLDSGDAENPGDSLNAHWRVVGATVERNVIVDCPEGIRFGDNYDDPPRDCTVRDNVVVNVDTGAAITQRTTPVRTDVESNPYYDSPSAAGMTRGADTVWRKAGYGPRLSLLTADDVGPDGDPDELDKTGAEVGGGDPGSPSGSTPGDVLGIGLEAALNHFELSYAVNDATTTSTATLQQIATGFSVDPYFRVVTVGTPPPAQTLGVGGIATPAAGPNVVLQTSDLADTLTITSGGTEGNPVIYDGQGHTVEKIVIEADYVTVQNFYVRGAGNAGIYSGPNTGVTIQNNDIAQVNEGGEGDINGITFFGDQTKILYNKIDNLVAGALNGSHTDGIQTWATASKNSSSDVVIKGNWINGPDESDERYIHQAVMAEGPLSTDGGGGGTGVSQNWWVGDNYFKTYGNQAVKFDDIHDVVITRNVFAGGATNIVETGDLSTGVKFYADNIITGDYDNQGISTTSGPGPEPDGGATEASTLAEPAAVQFRVRADSATTGGSSYPRSELRETRADGTPMGFDAMVGTHTLRVKARVTHLPAGDPEVLVAALDDGVNGERVSVQTKVISGQTRLVVMINGAEAARLSQSYVTGTEFDVDIRVNNGTVTVHDGGETPVATGQLVSTGSPSWYFRTGAHAQFDEATAGTVGYVAVQLRDLQVTHGGYGVNAGADASVVTGQEFTRLAQELGLTGVTSRRWYVVSRPTPQDPGTDPGEQPDNTLAAVRHNWGTPHPMSDEFNYTGAPNSDKWKLPGEGWAGHNGNGRRRPERQTVDGSKLVMTGLANGDTGWMQHKLDREYGRFEVRCRSYNTGTDNGNLYHPVLLIWPASNSRKSDGEYDFCENGEPGANKIQAFMHYPGDGDEQEHFEELGYDLSEWHNFGFEWTSQHLKGFIDGEEWFSVSGGAGGDKRNIQAMGPGHGTIQLDNFDGTNQTPATFEVEFYRLYDI